MNRKGLGSHTVNTKHESVCVYSSVFSYHCFYSITSEHTATGDKMSNSNKILPWPVLKKKKKKRI